MIKSVYIYLNDLRMDVLERIFQIARENVLEEIIEQINEEEKVNLKGYTIDWKIDYTKTLNKLISYIAEKVENEDEDKEYTVPYVDIKFTGWTPRWAIEDGIYNVIDEYADKELHNLNYKFSL